MIDSQRSGLDFAYLRSKLDWIQLPPFGSEDTLNPTHLELLMQASRDYHFRRYRSMADMTAAARRLFDAADDGGLTLSNQGLAAACLSDVTTAFDAFREARARWPGVAEHHYNCGVMVLKFSGQLEVAESCFLGATSGVAQHAPSWLAIAVIRLELGHYEGCVEAARQAIMHGASHFGIAALCLVAALERLGQPIEWPEPSPETPPPFAIPAPDAARAVLSVALGDREAEAALRLARSVHAVAPGWAAHLHLCNAAPALAEAAAQEGFGVSTETLLTDPPASLPERFPAIRLRTLAAFGDAFAGDLLLAHPRTVFADDPETLLPDAGQGVSLAIEDGLLWNQVGQDLIGLRRGPAVDAFLAGVRSATQPSPWTKAPMAAGVALWRTWQALPDARILTPDERVPLGDEIPASEAPPPRAEFNEVIPSRYGPMLLNRHDLYVSAGIREAGVWSPEEMDLLGQLIQPGQTVLDVGANMGTHTLAFCNFVGPTGAVHAFEPQRIMFQAMVATVAMNSWTNAYCHQTLVGAKKGRMRLPSIDYGEPSNFGMMTLAPDRARADTLSYRDDEAGEEVEMITVDGLDLAACHLIKIDVEGMEIDVLRGAAKTIRKHRPLVYMECQPDKRSQSSLKLLKSMGYATWWHGHMGSPNILGAPLERELSVLGLTPA